MAQPKKGFQFYLKALNQTGKDSHKNFQNKSTLKETNNIKEFYATKSVDSLMKQ